ncbi:MFS transporter [Pararhodobacter zhoushanensis]|uniref:MFS transporter n=1 Tax=Pararhodobacter zhoushanensis TaxID=2479545 RepID=A0ABT3GVC1_9RHOB|nr:MFS transporter [Pararhodobacter zhoushanensis]MCW1931489.1 MFS transporter [Pararhodobacter zhoushanensis]
MKTGLFFLVIAYVLSQFYRAFLAVLSPVLGSEIGAGPEDLALSSGLWFLAFALMQIPVGAALDRIGPRWTVSVLLALGGGTGALVFSQATGPWGIHLAMVLIGVGCSPVLMASYYIFGRSFRPALFGTLAAAIIGLGSLGNLAGAAPLAAVVAAFGWRETLIALAGVTLVVALALVIFVRDPERLVHAPGDGGSVLDVLRLPGLWLILPLAMTNYAAAAGIRGLWAGPYLASVHGADAALIGTVTLVMGLAMILGNFAYGPADRLFGSHKRVVLVGNIGLSLALAALWLTPGSGIWAAAALLAAVGFLGASFPVVMAHGRSFLPPHLLGRGVTLLNMFSISGVALMQFASRPVFEAASDGRDPAHAYGLLFLFFLLPNLVGIGFYLFARDRGEAGR